MRQYRPVSHFSQVGWYCMTAPQAGQARRDVMIQFLGTMMGAS
jgi:hypothetical protein